jgi:Ca2+-binding EF-hand superfamily protein
MRSFLSFSILAIAVCAFPVDAQDVSAPQGAQLIASKTMQMQDRDGDGRISLKESVGATVALFQSIDRNRTGLISTKEMFDVVTDDAAALKISTTSDQTEAMVAARFQMMDIDGDGSISLAEMLAVTQTLFDTADANADGYVSKAEMLAMAVTRVSEAGR